MGTVFPSEHLTKYSLDAYFTVHNDQNFSTFHVRIYIYTEKKTNKTRKYCRLPVSLAQQNTVSCINKKKIYLKAPPPPATRLPYRFGKCPLNRRFPTFFYIRLHVLKLFAYHLNLISSRWEQLFKIHPGPYRNTIQ